MNMVSDHYSDTLEQFYAKAKVSKTIQLTNLILQFIQILTYFYDRNMTL